MASWGLGLYWIVSWVSSSCSHWLALESTQLVSHSWVYEAASFTYLMGKGTTLWLLSSMQRCGLQETGNGSLQAVPRNWHRPISSEDTWLHSSRLSWCSRLEKQCALTGERQSSLKRNVWGWRLCVGCLWERPSATPFLLCNVWELKRSHVILCLSRSRLPSCLCIQGLGANTG